MRYKILTMLIILNIWCLQILASDIIGQSNIYYGVRASGLGGAFTAMNNDISGISYNPAAISNINRNYFYGMYIGNLYSLDFIKQNALIYAFPFKNTFHSLSVLNTKIEYNYNDIFVFDRLDWSENYYHYTFAFPFDQNNFFGASLGYTRVSSNITNGNAKGYNLNLGYIGKLTENFFFGISLFNLFGYKKWTSGLKEDELFAYRTGIKYELNPRIQILTDLDGAEDEKLKSIHLGSEFLIWSNLGGAIISPRREYFKYLQYPAKTSDYAFIIRAGLTKDLYGQKDLKYAFGFSLKGGSTSLDYSYERPDNNFGGSTHLFAFNVGFGPTTEIQYEKVEEKLKKEEEKKKLLEETKKAIEEKEQEKTAPQIVKSFKIAVLDFRPFVDTNIIIRLDNSVPEIIIKEIKIKSPFVEFIPKDIISLYSSSLNIVKVENSADARKLGIFLNADYLITGYYSFINNDKLIIRVQVYSTDLGLLLSEKDYFGSVEDLFDLLDKIASDVKNIIKY
ncbi:MAG TPA: hypothetical protein PLD27_04175 [bacterium]|nr:hypothetical protein [bacterium]HOL47346.1 hypothetical protein [bacterium]HPQ17987.1 hypothetical protein [bacterium]